MEVLEGKRLVHAHCYRADEILMLLRLAEELGFRIATLQHVLEGYKVAKEIAAHGAGASTFSDWWGYKVEASGATPWNAALMTRKGVLVSINSDSAEHSRRLNTEAAKSIKWGGLSDDEALALVTVNPARQLRVADRVGSIEPGKDADLVVWNRHPLSSYAVADRVYIDGALYYDRSKEDARVADRASRKAALVQAEKDAAAKDKKDDKKDDEQAGGAGGAADHGRRPTAPTGTGRTRAPGEPEAPENPKQPANLDVAIINARIHPITSASIERGTIVLKAGRIEALGADVAVPAGRAGDRRRRRGRLSGLHRPQHRARPRRAGSARLCRHGRIGRVQPAPADAHGLPPRQRGDSGRSRQRRHDGRRRAQAAASSPAKSR